MILVNRLFCIALLLLSQAAEAQSPAALHWADSVLNSLTPDQRIAQLMVVRTSTVGKDGGGIFFDAQTDSLVKEYNIGAVCLFQGTSAQQVALLNRIQGMAQTPIMVTVDGEWGLGMRFNDVQNFPYQLTIGAVKDAETAYQVGKAIAAQCKRIGIHVNYAPVVDINNNPNNPVIGVRSFGEDKYKVGLFGSRIMQGLQDNGVMACAKHFPGHGDVDVDSHFDLPVINKTMAQLENLELYPFKEVFSKGIGSVMVAHLSIPAIDSTPNKPTSISYNNITNLMRGELGYKGLTFTDALEMQGVKKYYPDGEASVQSVIAGNDMLCLPGSVPVSITKIKQAITDGRLTWESVNEKCKRVLLAKYEYVVGNTGTIDATNLTEDLNKDVPLLRKLVAENALTVLAMADEYLPAPKQTSLTVQELDSLVGKVNKKKNTKSTITLKKATPPQLNEILYISIGGDKDDAFAEKMGEGTSIKNLALPYSDSDKWEMMGTPAGDSYLKIIKAKRVVVGLHGIGRAPKGNFGIPDKSIKLIKHLQELYPNMLLILFGNCYSAKNFCDSKNLVVCYEDDVVFQTAAADWLLGKFKAKGTLPVTVCDNFKYGSGLVIRNELPRENPIKLGLKGAEYMALQIDSIANDAIKQGATPGCVVTVLKGGKLAFQKAYGYQDYDSMIPITANTIYDLASVTKISATNISVMKLWEEGRLDLKKKISEYLPWLKGSNKENLIVENLLLHQAGMVSFIPFYREVTGKDGAPNAAWFASAQSSDYDVPVADALYMKNAWVDTMYSRIKTSAVVTNELKYVYSDNDFILMGDIVASITGMPLDQYVKKTFYVPLGMVTTGFKPFEHFANSEVAPSEKEKQFRRQLLHGYVHDPGAAMFGNVAGHAGLFSDGYDLAILYQMLLNGGSFGGKRYLKKETIDWFTSYHTPISRRGMGYDKPEKNNDVVDPSKAYPCACVSPLTYGHTGYTGTCVWVDPKYDLVYIFLSNRVTPDGGENLKLSKLNVRSNIQQAIYTAMQ
ncbi:MAG: glycoside hydrolase family 3 N-terminal domain-containing protein [Chitinophagaceae bacterium]